MTSLFLNVTRGSSRNITKRKTVGESRITSPASLKKLKKVNEKTLRIDARPESSNIPIAIPLEPSLRATIAFEAEDFQFNIMSQGSQTGSLSPAPVVVAEGMPFEALLYQSTITNIT